MSTETSEKWTNAHRANSKHKKAIELRGVKVSAHNNFMDATQHRQPDPLVFFTMMMKEDSFIQREEN